MSGQAGWKQVEDGWRAVDAFIEERLARDDEALEQAKTASDAAGLPDIAVTAAQAKFLGILARSVGARRILEIGTLGGYSTIWLARALGIGGTVITLEIDEKTAEVARANLERAGLSDRTEVRLGAALDLLPELKGPFDFSFIDADKRNNPAYFEWAVRLSRPGALIVVDNVVREGSVADADSSDEDVLGTRELYDRVAAMDGVEASVIQTVGSKGWDGFLLARVG